MISIYASQVFDALLNHYTPESIERRHKYARPVCPDVADWLTEWNDAHGHKTLSKRADAYLWVARSLQGMAAKRALEITVMGMMIDGIDDEPPCVDRIAFTGRRGYYLYNLARVIQEPFTALIGHADIPVHPNVARAWEQAVATLTEWIAEERSIETAA